MKVLIAIKVSDISEQIVDQVIKRPWWCDTSFKILHVVSNLDSNKFTDWGLNVDKQTIEKKCHSAQLFIDKMVEKMRDKMNNGSFVEGEIRVGHICEQIIEESRNWDADLLIIGAHERTGVADIFLGNDARQLLTHAPCSVELLRLKTQKKEEKPAMLDELQHVLL